jgi:hypothetical protein
MVRLHGSHLPVEHRGVAGSVEAVVHQDAYVVPRQLPAEPLKPRKRQQRFLD